MKFAAKRNRHGIRVINDHEVRRRYKNIKRLKYYGDRCHYCGAVLTQATFSRDHIVPVSKGGGNNRGNIRPCCRRCNNMKRDLMLDDFREVFKRKTGLDCFFYETQYSRED